MHREVQDSLLLMTAAGWAFAPWHTRLPLQGRRLGRWLQPQGGRGFLSQSNDLAERFCSLHAQAQYKYVDDLAHVWCQWAEMELRNQNFKRALVRGAPGAAG